MDAVVTGPVGGRVAIVTGAGSGIGRDLALALASAGAQVAVTVRRLETGEETAALARQEGLDPLVVAMDVTDESAVQAGVKRVVAHFGRLDIVIHNAASPDSAYPQPAAEVDRDAWRRQADVTLGGALFLARSCHPHLARSGTGRFVVMTSNFGYHGAAMNAIYAAQKASLRGFIKSLAREWGGDGITVNSISPAAMTAPTRTFFSQYPQMEQAYRRKFALGGLGDPRRDIGGAAVALCSDALGYMTGQTLFMDGGLYPSA